MAEATYRLINGMDLKGSDVMCTFLSSGFPDNRDHIYNPVSDGKKLVQNESEKDVGQNCESDINGDDSGVVEISGWEGKFKASRSTHQKYSERPTYLANMCLLQFAQVYRSISKKELAKDISWRTEEPDISDAEGELEVIISKMILPKYIKLASGGYMALRLRPIVIRLHSSNKKNDHEREYSELLLFYPWRLEEELMGNDAVACRALYQKNKEIIRSNRLQIFPHSDMVCEMRDLMETSQDTKPAHLADNLNVLAEQENMDFAELQDPIDLNELPAEGRSNNNIIPDESPYKPVKISTRTELVEMANTLSFSQRVAFDKVITFCKSIRRAEKRGDRSTVVTPPLLLVHGNLDVNHYKMASPYYHTGEYSAFCALKGRGKVFKSGHSREEFLVVPSNIVSEKLFSRNL